MSNLTKIVNSVPLISGLALSACQGRPDNIQVDYKFSVQEISLIMKAMNEWSEAVDSTEINIPLSLHFNSDEKPYGSQIVEIGSEPVIYKIKTTDQGYDYLKEKMEVNELFGAADHFDEIIFVEDFIQEFVENKSFKNYGELFYKVALHEYGHFIGLSHLSSPHSVMANGMYAGVEACIDEETLKYYCDMEECGPHKHSTCKE